MKFSLFNIPIFLLVSPKQGSHQKNYFFIESNIKLLILIHIKAKDIII